MRADVIDVEEKPGNTVADVTVRVALRDWDAFKLTAPGGVWGRQRGLMMELTYEREEPTGHPVDGGVSGADNPPDADVHSRGGTQSGAPVSAIRAVRALRGARAAGRGVHRNARRAAAAVVR